MKHLKPTVLIILLHFFFEGNAQFTLRSGVNVSRLTNTQQNTVFKPVFLVEYELTSGWRYMRRRGTALLFAELYNTQKVFSQTASSVNVYGAGVNYTYRFKRYPLGLLYPDENQMDFQAVYQGWFKGRGF